MMALRQATTPSQDSLDPTWFDVPALCARGRTPSPRASPAHDGLGGWRNTQSELRLMNYDDYSLGERVHLRSHQPCTASQKLIYLRFACDEFKHASRGYQEKNLAHRSESKKSQGAMNLGSLATGVEG